MMARMARDPRTRVQASEGERRAARGLAATNPGGVNSGAMNLDAISSGGMGLGEEAVAAGLRGLRSVAGCGMRAHSPAKHSREFWAVVGEAGGGGTERY